MPEPTQHQSSGSDDSEQWSVVERDDGLSEFPHNWQMVKLRSARSGKLSAGLRCLDCGRIERIRPGQIGAGGASPWRGRD